MKTTDQSMSTPKSQPSAVAAFAAIDSVALEAVTGGCAECGDSSHTTTPGTNPNPSAPFSSENG